MNGSVVDGGFGLGTSSMNGLINYASSQSSLFKISFVMLQVASEKGHHFAGQYPPPNGSLNVMRQRVAIIEMYIVAKCPNIFAL